MNKKNIKRIIALSAVAALLAANKDVAIAEEIYTMEEQQDMEHEKRNLGRARTKARNCYRGVSYHKKG